MKIEVVESYGAVCLVGEPRPGLRKFGVPAGGPFDTESSRLANALLGNPLWSNVIELAGARLRLRFDEDTVVALVGGGQTVAVEGGDIALNQSFKVSRGADLEISPVKTSLRAYLAMPGGVHQSGAGYFSEASRSIAPRRLADMPTSLRDGPLRVTGGEIEASTVSLHQDRVGVRLHSAGCRTAEQSEASRPVVMGSVQRTPNGDLVVHGPDGPTIGGYQVEAVVIRADRDRIGQLAPGRVVEFETVSLEAATMLYEDKHRTLRRTLDRLSL